MSAIVIKSNKHSSIIMPSKNNPEQGSIMIMEKRAIVDNGFVNVRKRIGLLKGKLTDLQLLDWTEGSAVDLKVVYKESTTPFYEGQEPKKYPVGHVNEGQEITCLGAPIYVNKIVVSATSKEEDELLTADTDVKANAIKATTSFVGTEIK